MKRILVVAGLVVLGILSVDVSSARAGQHFREQIAPKYEGRVLYLQQNLFHDDGDAHWVNFVEDEYFRPGTKVTVIKARPGSIKFSIEGRTVSLDMDDAKPSYEVVVDRILGPEPPSLEGFTERERQAIDTATVVSGMSRSAVFVSIGYPPYHWVVDGFFIFAADDEIKNRNPMGDSLTYVFADEEYVKVSFVDERVVSVE